MVLLRTKGDSVAAFGVARAVEWSIKTLKAATKARAPHDSVL